MYRYILVSTTLYTAHRIVYNMVHCTQVPIYCIYIYNIHIIKLVLYDSIKKLKFNDNNNNSHSLLMCMVIFFRPKYIFTLIPAAYIYIYIYYTYIIAMAALATIFRGHARAAHHHRQYVRPRHRRSIRFSCPIVCDTYYLYNININ